MAASCLATTPQNHRRYQPHFPVKSEEGNLHYNSPVPFVGEETVLNHINCISIELDKVKFRTLLTIF